MEPARGAAVSLDLTAARGERGLTRMPSEVALVTVFPYGQRPDIPGALMRFLAREGIEPAGFAGSPSSLCILVPAGQSERFLRGLFDLFEFTAYPSLDDWRAAFPDKNPAAKEIACSYEEQIISTYNAVRYRDLDLWRLEVPSSRLAGLGNALADMQVHGLSMPFFTGQPGPQEMLHFALCLDGNRRDQVGRVLSRDLSRVQAVCHEDVSAFVLHGPHFGDRYGVVGALLTSLHRSGIQPLALSCAVSSMTVVVAGRDLDRALIALGSHFLVPPSP